MPVIADTDEPPAKCCKYCEESTHGVDGPVSWRLTLDQDLIDTLKGSFPSWFGQANNNNSTTTTTTTTAANFTTTTSYNCNDTSSDCGSSITTQITIETDNQENHRSNNNNKNNNSNQNTLHHINGNSLLSDSASPASSVASISSTVSSKKTCSSSCSSSASSCSSGSSSSSSPASSLSSSSSSRSSTSSSCSSAGSAKSATAAAATQTGNKTNSNKHNNSNSNNKSSKSSSKSAKSKAASCLKSSCSPPSSSSGHHSLGGGSLSSCCSSSLLATFSSPGSTATLELISDTASLYNSLLTTTTAQLSGKHFAHSFQDVILLHEAYDDMSEGEQRLNASLLLASSDDGTNSDFYDPRQSPPKAIVDSSPLQPAMDKNKESLKVKLMVRRPHSQLVEQGIIPPLKTSPAIHEQCKQLERAKTSDLLKAKIQQRPNREDLERRHILEEDECHIDPSLAEKQRMLKKARLADQLNSQIQHRPGPLELIKKNILHTEKPIEKIVKEGLVSFKATSEGLLTRPQHPSKYITFEDDSQSSESDTRQTPPRVGDELALVPAEPGATAVCGDMLQAAAASAGIVTVALTIPTSAGQVVVTSAPLPQPKFQTSGTKSTISNTQSPQPYVPPPPPLPPTGLSQAIQVKQETANLFEELCQSVAGPSASPGGQNYLPMIASPVSLGSTTSTLSPLSSLASPPHSLTPRPCTISSPALQLHSTVAHPKSDAPGKEKNRKKSKSKPISKARTIKFHEYKGPPSAAASSKLSADNSVEETSYQLMLEQQNCLLKFLETLNKNQSIMPATTTTTTTSAATTANTAVVGGGKGSIAGTMSSPAAISMSGISTDGTSSTASPASSTFSIISTPRPPPMPSPALSVSSSIPASPATSYAESTCSLSDITRLEKMKVSDLKMHLKRRNLPVSGPKPQLIERLKPYLPLDAMDTSLSNVNTSSTVASSAELVTISPAPMSVSVDAMDATSSAATDAPVAMIVNSPRAVEPIEPEQMDVVQQVDSPRSVGLQTLVQPQPQTATIILSNEDLLREQQRKIDELQRQLQRSQQELQQIRQRQQQQQQQQQLTQSQNQTVSSQVVGSMPTQQITLITTPSPAAQTVALVPQMTKETSTNTTPMKTNAKSKGTNATAASSNTPTNQTTSAQPMTQKMVVKQQLEAKIQKQKQAAAAAAQAQAQAQAQVLAQSMAQAQTQTPTQLRLLTQKTQTVLIPTNNNNNNNAAKLTDKAAGVRQKNSNNNNYNSNLTTTTTTILANQLPLTKATNNLGLVWNEGNQTIFLVGLNDQQMTAHTIGNISLAGASPATKKLLNGHQRTSSLPSIVFPITTTTTAAIGNAHEQHLIETKPLITQHQLLQLQQQQQQQQQQRFPLNQQIIQLDIKPQNLPPPPPPPPPQYEEATKQLAATKSTKGNKSQHNSVGNVKIKEEPQTLPAATQTSNVATNTSMGVKKSKKPHIKSEKLTDVLDILIKQGELPESAVLEPITPMTDLSGNLIFTTDAESGKLVPKLEPPSSVMDSLSAGCDVLPMETETQQSAQDVFQLLNSSADISQSPQPLRAASVAPVAVSYIENIDMASPLQPGCHIDAESVAKTLDIFLEQNHSTPSPPNIIANNNSSTHLHHQQSSPMHQHHDMLAKQPACSTTSPERVLSQVNGAGDDEKLNHFDEFELLELMSQQLEMDIGDECGSFGVHSNGVSNQQQQQQFHHHQQHSDKCGPPLSNGLNGLRRDMNPSLQPSISDLIQQQMQQHHNANQQHLSHHHHHHQHQQQQQHNNNSNSSPTHLSGNNNGATAVTASTASSLDPTDFDFVEQLNQHHQQQQQQQQQQLEDIHHHHHTMSHNGTSNSSSNNNNNNSSLSSHSHSHVADDDDVDDVVNHFASTPMDVCDDFDNPLGSFSFSALSPDSNINTPPHPFGSTSSAVGLGLGCATGSGSSNSTCSMAAMHPANSAQLQLSHHHHQHNHNHQPLSEQMSICGSTSSGPTVVDNVSDAFGAGGHLVGADNILDLFNIDDYKMSWGEGDFAV